MDIITQARQGFLREGYGKFDLVEKIFPIEILLNEKPRQLKILICEKLSICSTDINYQTFASWRRRFKNKHLQTRSPLQLIVENDKRKEDDWRNFQPSEPSKQPLLNEPLLKTINYK